MLEGEFAPDSPGRATVEMLRGFGYEVVSVKCVRRRDGAFDCEAELADGDSWEGMMFVPSIEYLDD
jgi:hypothetical protein